MEDKKNIIIITKTQDRFLINIGEKDGSVSKGDLCYGLAHMLKLLETDGVSNVEIFMRTLTALHLINLDQQEVKEGKHE